jgi:L-amino acid N-acyltransferase YncA
MAEGRPESSKNFVYKLFVAYVNNEKAERLEDAVTMADVEESAEWASQVFVSSVLASMDGRVLLLTSGGLIWKSFG